MDFIDKINNNIKFMQRAVPVPLGARTSYRIAQICLIMSFCCNPRESCSVQKIQTISNALFQPYEFKSIVQYTKNRSMYLNFTPRIDPCVNMALEFAVKYGLCSQVQSNRRYKLTVRGRKYVAAIYRDEIMQKETSLLQELGASFDEDIVNSIFT